MICACRGEAVRPGELLDCFSRRFVLDLVQFYRCVAADGKDERLETRLTRDERIITIQFSSVSSHDIGAPLAQFRKHGVGSVESLLENGEWSWRLMADVAFRLNSQSPLTAIGVGSAIRRLVSVKADHPQWLQPPRGQTFFFFFTSQTRNLIQPEPSS